MTKALIILGTGGNSYEVLDIIEAVNATGPTWSIVGFLDDVLAPGSRHLGFPVLGPLAHASRFQQCSFLNAIGSDRSYLRRREIVASAQLRQEQFATVVHPAAFVSSRACLGRGVYANYGVFIGGGVVIGDQIALGPGVMVGHDAIIEDYCMIQAGATILSAAHVGHSCYIGARAVIRQQRIGEQALVGMGAVVVRDVAPGSTVVGNPARPVQRSANPCMDVLVASSR